MFVINVGVQRGKTTDVVPMMFLTEELRNQARKLIRQSKHLSVKALLDPPVYDTEDKMQRAIDNLDTTGWTVPEKTDER